MLKWVFDGELNIQDLRPTIKVLIPSTDFIGQKWNLIKLKLHPNAKENFKGFGFKFASPPCCSSFFFFVGCLVVTAHHDFQLVPDGFSKITTQRSIFGPQKGARRPKQTISSQVRRCPQNKVEQPVERFYFGKHVLRYQQVCDSGSCKSPKGFLNYLRWVGLIGTI